MTLREAFEAMRQEHQPNIYWTTRPSKQDPDWWNDGNLITESVAESAICWAMVKALWERGGVDFVPVKGGVFCVSTPRVYHYERPGEELPALVFVYADRFPKEKA